MKIKFLKIGGRLLVALALALGPGCASKDLVIKKIIDGDTLDINGPDGEARVRLYGIDAPEIGQRYGQDAKNFLEVTAKSEDLQIDTMTQDHYGRVVGVLYIDGRNINREMVKAGAAWVYRPFCRAEFCPEWVGLESDARINRRGLWYDQSPVPPWEWRR